MNSQQQDPKPEDEATKEQGQADDRRRKDQSEKLERDRADEAGRRSRRGTCDGARFFQVSGGGSAPPVPGRGAGHPPATSAAPSAGRSSPELNPRLPAAAGIPSFADAASP